MERQTMQSIPTERQTAQSTEQPEYAKYRNIFLIILFSVCTLGFYYVYWTICLTNNTNCLSKYKTANGLLLYPFCFLTLGIYYLYWLYMLGKKTGDIDGDHASGIFFLVLGFFCLGIIAEILAQCALNRAARRYREQRRERI